MKEEELVQRAQSGQTSAFSELVRTHQQFVYNLALRAVNDPKEAEDLSQEAFLRAWLALPRFRRQSSFRTWLYRIVVNLCYNRLPGLRQELASLPVENDLEDSEVEIVLPANEADDPAGAYERQDRIAFVQRQIKHLPEGQRLMIMLRYQQDLAYEEIADIMNLPLGTVKTGLFRAHQRLRQSLQAYEAGEERVNHV